MARVMRTKQVSHSADKAVEPVPGFFAEHGGARTQVIVPMLKDDALIGAIVIYRQEVRPFTAKQIELLQNFAAQAVIAIENARLLNELRESPQQQTATAEVLKVIARTQGELQSVFETMLAKATELCEASYGALWLHVDDGFRYAALHGDLPQIWTGHLRNGTVIRVRPDVPLARLLQTLRPVPIPDMRTDPGYLNGDPLPVSGVDIGGIRTLVVVPMIKNDDLVGAIAIYRKEVRPFAEKQVELLSNFAAQAVIAIENARLLNELRQSLEQQTATSEVLKIIAGSPGKLEPVFSEMLGSATRICEAKFGTLLLYDGNTFRVAAGAGTPPELAEFERLRGPFRPELGSRLERIVGTRQVIHIVDDAAEDVPSPPTRLAGARSIVAVPMLKDDMLIGAISIYRQEVRPFTDKQIALLVNFAAQAVIAIENARLLHELQESLAQQTATADVLRIIASSPGELDAVFKTMLKNARHICNAKFGILMLREADGFRSVAIDGAPAAYTAAMRENPHIPPRPGSGLVVLVETKKPVQIADVQAEPGYVGNRLTQLAGARTLLIVPLLKDDTVIGAINIYRQEVRTFTEQQVALVQNFAAQAVIAIENARLLKELRERTDQLQTQSQELASLNQQLEQRVADRRDRAHGPAAALFAAAGGRSDRRVRRRAAAREPSSRDHRLVLRSARLHRLFRELRSGRRDDAAAPISCGDRRDHHQI